MTDSRFAEAMSGGKGTKVGVINCGSSSIKYEVFDRKGGIKLATGLVERIGSAEGRLRQSRLEADGTFVEKVHAKPLADHHEAFNFMVDMNRENRIIRDDAELSGGRPPGGARRGAVSGTGRNR